MYFPYDKSQSLIIDQIGGSALNSLVLVEPFVLQSTTIDVPLQSNVQSNVARLYNFNINKLRNKIFTAAKVVSIENLCMVQIIKRTMSMTTLIICTPL